MISLTLGGGYGFLTGRHGLTIDNLVGATVVIADGRVLQVNRDENQDVSSYPVPDIIRHIQHIRDIRSAPSHKPTADN
jgi:FAD/FMN-containing dehydrogenase